MSDFNSTMSAASVSPPRDLIIQTNDVAKEGVTLQWQPPKQSNGPITGIKKSQICTTFFFFKLFKYKFGLDNVQNSFIYSIILSGTTA